MQEQKGRLVTAGQLSACATCYVAAAGSIGNSGCAGCQGNRAEGGCLQLSLRWPLKVVGVVRASIGLEDPGGDTSPGWEISRCFLGCVGTQGHGKWLLEKLRRCTGTPHLLVCPGVASEGSHGVCGLWSKGWGRCLGNQPGRSRQRHSSGEQPGYPLPEGSVTQCLSQVPLSRLSCRDKDSSIPSDFRGGGKK